MTPDNKKSLEIMEAPEGKIMLVYDMTLSVNKDQKKCVGLFIASLNCHQIYKTNFREILLYHDLDLKLY